MPFTVEEWTGIGLFSEDYAFRVFGGPLGMHAFTVWSLLLKGRPNAAWSFGVFLVAWVAAYIWMQRGFRVVASGELAPMQIEPYDPKHLDHVVRLSLRAWTPVFASLREQLAPEVYQAFYPDGWQVSQEKSVKETCTSADMKLWVATESGPPVGFVAARLHNDSSLGEIYMIAVDPDHQRKGIAAALSEVALAWMKEVGMSIAMVETGGDPGHGPARGLYAHTGFRALPLARYFKKL